MMVTIHTLPPEIILEILQWHVTIDVCITFCAIFRAAWVCHRWRSVAFGNALFWRTVNLSVNDVRHTEVVTQTFARSGTQPIEIALDLTAPAWAFNGKEKFRGFLELVRPHLRRSSRLEVYADETDWADILTICDGESFPRLDVLIAHCYEDWEVYDDDAEEQDEVIVATSNSTALQAVASPPSPTTLNTSNTGDPISAEALSFPLPPGHRLHKVQLYGMSLSDVILPHLRHVSIVQAFSDIVSANGILHPLLFNTVAHLELEQIYVPPMTAQTHAELPLSPLRSLVLSGLRATPHVEDGADAEHDCHPFFSSLSTLELRSLELQRFHATGRVWPDFLASLSSAQDRYPRVSSLVLREMPFDDLGPDELNSFLGSFPALQGLELRQCSDVGSRMIQNLNTYPKLCPLLQGLLVDGASVSREAV
ncbi:hypothetical protein C8F04DRAFT_1306085 [Mycena alexandri]|uniref:F-box domain-containing protein n=1 Tax=Mycena alexandri TaxID=1745969 RepID=A0AAD6SBI6_9AGAR|nr:hypothetical protein C8F04DRAFT_1306085 [Mycena alexandri]